MIQYIDSFFVSVSGWLWGWPMVILLLGCHLFLTIRLKFPQRKLLTGIKLSITKDRDADGDISQFEALVTSLAATIGTGNIIGVAVAVTLGGPGAVFWCWITGVLGISTKYTEALLAVNYRVKKSDGSIIGGPMYTIERGMGRKWKWLAISFAIFTMLSSFGIGSSVQSNAFATIMDSSFGVPKYISGIFVTIAVVLVTLFGVKGIANVCKRLIPFMAILYIGGCLYILLVNAQHVGEALDLIITSAFSPRAAGGGFVGASIMTAARYGISRGLFSNESGLGSAPIVAAAAKSRNPARQAIISSTGTFWDTVIICALTGLTLVCSVIAYPDIDTASSDLLTHMVFQKIPYVGTIILAVSIATFSFSTIIGWYYYAIKAAEYLGGKVLKNVFRVVWYSLAYFGAVMSLDIVWNLADITNALMSIPNIISLIVLSGFALKLTNYYLWEDRLDENSEDNDILDK